VKFDERPGHAGHAPKPVLMTIGFSKAFTTNRQQTVSELESPILDGLVRFANEWIGADRELE
jgi:hypothetical protein